MDYKFCTCNTPIISGNITLDITLDNKDYMLYDDNKEYMICDVCYGIIDCCTASEGEFGECNKGGCHVCKYHLSNILNKK